jgi:phage tail-like protein
MTHPQDKIYRFRTPAHWGLGAALGLLFGEGDDLSLRTVTRLVACRIAKTPDAATQVRRFARDVAGRLIWLNSDGTVWLRRGAQVTRVTQIAPHLAADVHAFVWGQTVGWIAQAGGITRLDVRNGDRTGSFSKTGRTVIAAVPDVCDGVVVAEHDGRGHFWLRQIRADGAEREDALSENLGEVITATRQTPRAPVQLVATTDTGWQTMAVQPGSDETPIVTQYSDDAPAPTDMVATKGPHRLLFGTPQKGIFSVARGLREPLQNIAGPAHMGDLVDLVWLDGALYAATQDAVYHIEDSVEAAQAREAHYMSPVLRSPLGMRSGWQRADLFAHLPEGAQIRIRSRGFANSLEINTYKDLLRTDPQGPALAEGWNDAGVSVHNGLGSQTTLRHFLGDVKDEYVALRIDISVPACVPPVEISGLDVLYPDRSIIEQLPDVYQTGGAGEIKTRRMLAPFQALADEIDDLIGSAVRRVDPATADGLWAGFLLSWLGHGGFSGLPEDLRKRLLTALPEILPSRGTLAGLKHALDALAPDGYAIDDSALRPDLWILPEADDPAGARLGCDTAAIGHQPPALVLGACLPLNQTVLNRACGDPYAFTGRCSADVTVWIFGPQAEARIGPFTDRIIRHFVPANCRVRFEFGATPKAPALNGGSPGLDDPKLTLDAPSEPKLGRWTLPATGPGTERAPETIETAVLDGTLILK